MQNQFAHPSQDRPIHGPAEDRLDRGPFVQSLVRALVRDERDAKGLLVGRQATGFVVGLTGKWGLGKSSILHLLAAELGSMDRVIVSVFNPWLFNGRDELLRGFFSGLRDAMGRSNVENARELATALDRYWGAVDLAGHAVAAVADVYGAAGAATTGWKLFSKKAKAEFPKKNDLSPEVERKHLEKKLAKMKVAVVVLIDELDRVEDGEVRAVAQLVKAVGDIEGLSYLVAYDADRVIDALGRGEGDGRKASGAHYLEKIIQLPIPLRPLFGEDVDALLKAELEHRRMSLPVELSENEQEIFEQIKREIETPRDVKRLVGAYAILELATRGEISDIDVLGYSWITVKSPDLREILASDCDKAVSDPIREEVIERLLSRRDSSGPPPIEEAFGACATRHEKLLALIFPRFAKRSANQDDGTRLYHRRNLIRLLYLGNPPGAVSREELEATWSISDSAEMEKKLSEMLVAGKLRAFIDRMDDLLPRLSAKGDFVFWPALSRVLTRSHDLTEGLSLKQAVSRDAVDTLFGLGARNTQNAERVKLSMNALIADGDLVLVPGILRKHMFAHGLTHHGSARGGEVVYDKVETQRLLAAETPRYRAAVVDGTALRQLPNVEAVFALGNSGAWDASLRDNFTNQLEGREALSTVAALLVPPGYSADLKSLNELFDAERVYGAMKRLGEIEPPLDKWTADAFRSLKWILAGKDPNFDDEEETPVA